MADPANIQQVLIALKKGTQLVKYSRKGKPKVCPFRISSDETAIVWFSHKKKERTLRLDSVVKISPGQRTAVFRRYLRPEKDYLSFSLIYNNGERSLDLICKDQAELEVWIAGLRALVSAAQSSRSDSYSDGNAFSDDGDSVSSGSLSGNLTLQSTSGTSHQNLTRHQRRQSLNALRSDAVLDHANMQIRLSNGDGSRTSISSAPSSGAGEDIENLGDLYVWGNLWSDGVLSDISTPKLLESDVVLDVQQIACGVRHAALLTRQGEVFTWGEDCSGQLGHGNDKDVTRPRHVQSLMYINMEFVACGEYHSCAISNSGDLFTWGDGAGYPKLLGHGVDVSHWIPTRVASYLDGHPVAYVSCGTWHSALITMAGKLYTFGDGTFGVLGHGDRESVTFPREVRSLAGLKTSRVACGVWHTAAVVEVMGQVGSAVVPRKLFTWGDGDKHRLGHGDKEARLVPTCVPSLIEYNFLNVDCAHNVTVALTTSGHVFTMGSAAHGQLGHAQSDGKVPCLVQDRLVGELVEEIACGAYHVAALTSRSELYTWGKGSNGQLGHGDTEDRRTPTLVEALKDRHVKSISCGSNFTACICIHKWVSSADQLVCSGCRLPFGFARKRHNCYNCGLVHCYNCCSKKVLKAALASAPGKPHRVCDSCFSKLKAAEAGVSSVMSRKNVVPRRSMDIKETPDRAEVRCSKFLLSPYAEPAKYLEAKPAKNENKSETLSILKASHVPLLQLKDISFTGSLSVLQTALKPIVTAGPQAPAIPRPSSPYARKTSPGRQPPPGYSKGVIDNLTTNNEVLNQEVLKLQAQVRHMNRKCDAQDLSLQSSDKKIKEESAKCIAALGVIRSLNTQLKDTIEKSPEVGDTLKAMHAQAETFLKQIETGRPAKPYVNNGMREPSRVNPAREELELSDSIEGDAQISSVQLEAAGDDGVISQGSSTDHSAKPPQDGKTKKSEGREPTEQFEHGVFITYVQLSSGVKLFKRVQFSKRRFVEHQAEDWWNKNKDRVFSKFSYSAAALPAPALSPREPGEDAPSSSST